MKRFFSWISWFIITGGTTSYWFFGIAPGTAGSFFTMIGLWICYMEGLWSADFFIWGIIGSYLVGLIFIPAGERLMVEKWGAGKKYGKEERVLHDHGVTVIDEINGMFVSNFSVHLALQWQLMPTFNNGEMLMTLFSVFVMFRCFDIFKVFGIRVVEDFFKNRAKNVQGGRKSFIISSGIIFDDTLGGIYTFIFSLVIILITSPNI